MTQHDGSFRRLAQTVRDRRALSTGRPGRPPKNRIATTGHFGAYLHEQMRAAARTRSEEVERIISISDMYNEAAEQMIFDLHDLLGSDFRLPAGAVSLTGILGLRELVDRPVRTPLRELPLQPSDQLRTTLYFDKPMFDGLVELSMRFGLQMRRPIHIHRLIELSAAWFVAGLETANY